MGFAEDGIIGRIQTTFFKRGYWFLASLKKDGFLKAWSGSSISSNYNAKRGRPITDLPLYDDIESPSSGYPWASCSPAESASVSPDLFYINWCKFFIFLSVLQCGWISTLLTLSISIVFFCLLSAFDYAERKDGVKSYFGMFPVCFPI